MNENEIKEPVEEEAVVETVESTVKPKLWNPNVAANWCLLFTPIFGAWLHSKNWKTLGDEDKAKKSMYWVYAGIPILFITLFSPMRLSWLFLVVWYFVAARKQVKYVKDELDNEYERKLWKAPLKFGGIGLVCAVALSLVFSSPGTTKMLEKESVSVVNEIIEENYFGEDEMAECIRVKIEEQVTGEKYKATALLDNGNEIDVMVSWDGETVGVVMSAEYF